MSYRLYPSCSIFILASLLIHMKRSGKRRPGTWIPSTHVEDIDTVQGSCIQPGPALAVGTIWEINQKMKDFLFFSLYSSLSAPPILFVPLSLPTPLFFFLSIITFLRNSDFRTNKLYKREIRPRILLCLLLTRNNIYFKYVIHLCNGSRVMTFPYAGMF